MNNIFRWESISLLVLVFGFLFVTQNVELGIVTAEGAEDKKIRIVSVFTVLTMLIFIVIVKKLFFLHKQSNLITFLYYIFFCGLSIASSVSPVVSLFKVVELVVLALIITVAVNNNSSRPVDFLYFVISVYVLILLTIMIQAVLYPNHAFMIVRGETPFFGGMLTGVFPTLNPNTVGFLAGVSAVVGFSGLTVGNGNKIIFGFCLLIGFVAIVLSYSRGAVIDFSIVIIIIMIINKQYKLLLYFLIPVFSYLLIEYLPVLVEHFLRGKETTSADSLLSGRLLVWQQALSSDINLLIGEGYSTGFRENGFSGSRNAHNSVVEILYNTGIFALMAWLLVFYKLFTYIKHPMMESNISTKREKTVYIGIFIYMVLSTLTNIRGVYLGWDIFIMIALIIYSDKIQLHTSLD